MLLCDAVARGLIQPISERDSAEPAPTGLKGKNRAEKRSERAASTHGASVEPAALQDVYKALEVCHCVECRGEKVRWDREQPCCALLQVLINTLNSRIWNTIDSL